MSTKYFFITGVQEVYRYLEAEELKSSAVFIKGILGFAFDAPCVFPVKSVLPLRINATWSLV